MVNWTNFSIKKENTWKKDKNYDLPVPSNIHECSNLINEVDELLGLFESDDIYDDYEYRQSTGIELLQCLHPSAIAASQYSDTWEDEVRMWLFAEEIFAVCRYGSSVDRKNFLIEVCQEYLRLLYDRHTEFGGEIKDIK